MVFSLLEQFLMYTDSAGLDGPMDMETDGPLLDDVGALKKAVEEEAAQARKTDVSVTESLTVKNSKWCQKLVITNVKWSMRRRVIQ